MWKPLAPAVFLACLVGSPLAASPLKLPSTAPLPPLRPAIESVVAPALRFDPPIAISPSPQPIPEGRLNVRIIGPDFLPPRSQQIDFAEAGANRDPLMVQWVEDALSAAVRGAPQPAPDQQTSIASSE